MTINLIQHSTLETIPIAVKSEEYLLIHIARILLSILDYPATKYVNGTELN